MAYTEGMMPCWKSRRGITSTESNSAVRGNLVDYWNDGELECRIVFTLRVSLLPSLQYSFTPVLQYSNVLLGNQEYNLLQTVELRFRGFLW